MKQKAARRAVRQATFAATPHYTPAEFPPKVSKFGACGFTAVFRDEFAAPYVAESPLSIGLRLLEEHPIRKGTVPLVGAVEHVYLAENGLRADGTLDLVAMGDACISGLDAYLAVAAPVRFGYARPVRRLRSLFPAAPGVRNEGGKWLRRRQRSRTVRLFLPECLSGDCRNLRERRVVAIQL